MRRVAPSPFSIVGAVAATHLASAQPSTKQDASLEAVTVRVDGFAGCPSGEDFWRRLQPRLPGVRPSRPGETARLFAVRFREEDGGQVKGRLRIDDVEGRALEREVSGATCVEVADALALIAAVAARSDLADDTSAAIAADASLPLPAPDAAPPLVRDDRDTWNVLVRGQLSTRTRIVPGSLYGAGAGFELMREGASSFQPALGATLEATLTSTASTDHVVPNTEMSGQLVIVHLFASPWRLRAGAALLRPCVSLDVGRLALEGKGGGLAGDVQEGKFWLAFALAAEADVRLGRGFRAGASAGAEVHPFLYQFQYTGRDVYQVGSVGFVASTRLAYRFE